MNNAELVQQLIFAFQEMRIQEIIVCAGARNIPIVEFLEKNKSKFLMTSFFEERSAAFYALGRIKTTGRPVAIVTTSGTAAVETFPAVIEAYYQGLPLIVVTADRPKAYRGTGAPQAIEQQGLFHKYCMTAVDWDTEQQDFSIQFNPERPFHFNVSFEEPLLDQVKSKQNKKINLKFESPLFSHLSLEPRKLNPLVLVSELSAQHRDTVVRFLKENKLYFIAESLSGLKNHSAIKAQELNHIFYSFSNHDSIQLCQNHFDSIIRIGGIPTIRLWRDLEYDLKHFPVLSFSERNFPGLSRLSRVFPLAELGRLKVAGRNNLKLEQLNQKIGIEKSKFLKKHKNSEQSFFSALCEVIGNDPLYLGNSLPIREWDEFSSFDQKKQAVYGNRGANGIDGQVSTYLGWARDFRRSWCVIGDLTALYDLAALTMTTTTSKNQKCIIVVNNCGGQIFSRLFKNQKYLNGHKLGFKNWAQMFGWKYFEVKTIAALNKIPKSKNVIIEIKINNKYSEQFNTQFKRQALEILTADQK